MILYNQQNVTKNIHVIFTTGTSSWEDIFNQYKHMLYLLLGGRVKPSRSGYTHKATGYPEMWPVVFVTWYIIVISPLMIN